MSGRWRRDGTGGWRPAERWRADHLTPTPAPSFCDRVARALKAHEPKPAPRDLPFREAAVALVLRPRDDDAELLMLRRATHETDPWSGQIALPGGRREPTDASLLQTAIRETREETTLDLADVPVLGALDELRPRTPSLPPFVVRPYVFVVQDVPALTQSVEVAELFWAPLGRLFDARHAARSDVHPQGLRMTVDAIDFDGRIIWGMTERILRSFQHVLSTI